MITAQARVDEIKTKTKAEEIINQIARETNSLIEEQVLIGQIMRENQKDLTEYVEELKKQNAEEQIDSKKEEYKNSAYYTNYLNILQAIDMFATDAYNMLLWRYSYNASAYYDSFVERLICSAMIRNIGFPIPDFFYNEMLNMAKEKMKSFPINPELEFTVEIKPIQYAKVGNVYKNYDAYILNIELRTKQKQKSIV